MEYLSDNRKEICNMISVLHDEEFLTEAVLLSARNEGRAEGKLEGAIEFVNNLMKNNFKIDEACKLANIDIKTYKKYMAEYYNKS